MKQAKPTVIKVSAPGKLLLLGDHAVVHGFPCLVTAVDFRITASVSQSNTGKDFINAPQAKDTSFVTQTLASFRSTFNINKFFHVETKAMFTHSYGLGGSSASTVAVAYALQKLFALKLTLKELFNFCYQVVLKVQGVGSGFDIAAAIYGKSLYFVTAGVEITPIDFHPPSFIVAYSGQKGDTASLVKIVSRKYKTDPQIKKIFHKSQQLVNEAQNFLRLRNYGGFGKLMTENHHLLQQLEVSTPMLDQLVDTAVSSGAYGAKLSGAGGGDCIIAIAPLDKITAVKNALTKVGGLVINVSPNAEGVRING